MRRYFLITLFALMAHIGLFAQQSVVVYNGGNTIFSKQLWEIDSIVFVSDSLPDYCPLEKSAAVDLGLNVKWAPQNVGSASPFDCGLLFGWGETTSLTHSDNLKFYPFEGVSQGISETAYDIAKVRWGKAWSMPTVQDFKELIDNCTWEIVDTAGVKVYKVSNGDATIYFPVIGYRAGATTVTDEFSFLWSGDIAFNEGNAYALQISSEEETNTVKASVIDKLRSLGIAVRPVYRPATVFQKGTPYISFDRATVNISTGGDLEDIESYGIEMAVSTDILMGNSPGTIYKASADPKEGYNATVVVEGLDERTTYYYRLFAETITDGKIYTDTMSLTTLKNTHEYDYVDLGLPSGLKWAKMNLGAKKSSDYGSFFAWGETETKSSFTRDNYVMVNENGEKVDSCITENGIKVKHPTYGYYTLVNILESISDTEYDASQQVWGDMWRIPTKAEFQELRDYCKWTWGEENGVAGARATGPNGNSIFLPAAGQQNGTNVSFTGRQGNYWTANIYDNEFSSDYGDAAYPFAVSDNNYRIPLGTQRHLGLSIRPVRK